MPLLLSPLPCSAHQPHSGAPSPPSPAPQGLLRPFIQFPLTSSVRIPCSGPRRITSPKRKDDAKVVGALLMKMLQYFEKQTGERVLLCCSGSGRGVQPLQATCC